MRTHWLVTPHVSTLLECEWPITYMTTGKTNSDGYELYCFGSEAHGQSMPLVFVFVTTTADYAPGDKEEVLREVLRFLKPRCPNIKFTLADKDVIEIAAYRGEIPTAKHQSCYWHGKKYVKERLAEDKPPAAYSAKLAHRVFDFIDPTWAPGVTAQHREDGVHPDDHEKSLEVSKAVSI